MNFCPGCGSPRIRRIVPTGDIGLRHTCDACGALHYSNPNVVAGCLATHAGRVVLCRRAIPPFEGDWTIPAGYLEMGETVEEAAAREAREEAGLVLRSLELFALYNLPTFGELYVLYVGELLTPSVMAGPESREVALVAPADIPWDSLAFPMVREALQHWCSSAPAGAARVHGADFIWGPEGAVRVRRQLARKGAAACI